MINAQKSRYIPKRNDVIKYKMSENSDWSQGTVLSRAGKQTAKFGRNQQCINLQPNNGSSPICVNLKDAVDWECLPSVVENVNVVSIPDCEHSHDDCVQAKEKELNAFHQFGVYDLVKDEGQSKISSMWVLTKKNIDGRMATKARLVARGFQEANSIQSDSPTCHKDSFKIFLCVAASNQWSLECTDIKSAFLQGQKMSREVFIEPPTEAKIPGYIWRLNKCMYGLQDASRNWFFSVVAALKSLKCIQLKLDLAVFIYVIDGRLCGIIIVHVDDFLHIGNSEFKHNVIQKLREMFLVGSTGKDMFSYIGMDVTMAENGIIMSQIKYVNKLSALNLDIARKMEKDSALDKSEHERFRKIVGQLNWVAQHTRPDLMFEVLELSMKLSKPCVQDYTCAVKAMRKLQSCDVGILVPNLRSDKYQWKLVVFSDAAFANLSDKVSSASGYVIFLVDSALQCSPLGWKANKIKRKVRSTLAAEALALENALEHAIFMRELLKEMCIISHDIPILAWTDNNNAYESIHSTSSVEDFKLRLEIACIKENMLKENVSVKWCKGEQMLANCLTKKGASADSLLNVITSGTFVNLSYEL